jgi:predicted DNA-binding transcriptional regulator AlpA
MRRKKVDAVTAQLPDYGFLRLKQVLQLLPISQTRWYDGVRNGEFPKPIRLWPGAKASFYRASEIKALLKKLGEEGKHAGADA